MRLLLAEDEKALSNALATILRHNNFSVDAVYDGEECLEFLKTEIYDALILDIMMPKKDGIQVLKELRANGNNIPIIMLTAKTEIQDRIAGLDAGADDYLNKPFSSKELMARIRAITRRKCDQVTNNLTFGDIELDRSTYELISGKNKLVLSSKEYQLLELLIINQKQLLSIDKIMDKIWGLDSESEINVVWTYISYLRKKLKILDSKVIIKANRNIGYTLEYTDDQKA